MLDTQQLHECRQAHHCKSRTRAPDNTWHGGGVEKPGSLCRPCEAAAFTAIRCLGDDYLSLQAAIYEPRGRIDGPKVSGTAERKVPIPLDIDTLMMAVDDELFRWALRVTRGDPVPAGSAERVLRCTTIISASLGTLVDLPVKRMTIWLPLPYGGDVDGAAELDGVDGVLRLAKLHHRAQCVLGLVERTNWLPEPCHVCGMKALTSAIEASLITCQSCRNCWDQDEFARLNNPWGIR